MVEVVSQPHTQCTYTGDSHSLAGCHRSTRVVKKSLVVSEVLVVVAFKAFSLFWNVLLIWEAFPVLKVGDTTRTGGRVSRDVLSSQTVTVHREWVWTGQGPHKPTHCTVWEQWDVVQATPFQSKSYHRAQSDPGGIVEAHRPISWTRISSIGVECCLKHCHYVPLKMV